MVADVTVADVVAVLDRAYPRTLAESWDSVGLVCGDPGDPARRVSVCVDVTAEVVDAAIRGDVGLIVAHHPLLLRGVDTVAADTAKGALLHRLIRSRVALFTAHTNADSARPGVSDALADLLGLADTVPVDPQPARPDGPAAGPLDKWVVMAPDESAEIVRAAMFAAGAGAIGEYRDCSWSVSGIGRFEPQGTANPTIGALGEPTTVREARVEMVARRTLRADVLAALRSAHPYEEPAFDVLELADVAGETGLGRVGALTEPTTAADFVGRVAVALASPWGVRATGDPDRPIRSVAVCGGAGDSLLDAVRRLNVDAYVTGDLRHHPADEAIRAGGPMLVDAGHWATEFPWCDRVVDLLTVDPGVPAEAFRTPTDPFVLHAGP